VSENDIPLHIQWQGKVYVCENTYVALQLNYYPFNPNPKVFKPKAKDVTKLM